MTKYFFFGWVSLAMFGSYAIQGLWVAALLLLVCSVVCLTIYFKGARK